MGNNDYKEYMEEDAIAAIRKELPPETSDKYSDDDLLEIIDALWDFYEDKGLLDIDPVADEEDDFDTAEATMIAEALIKRLAKNGPQQLNKEDLVKIIEAEIHYEESLEA